MLFHRNCAEALATYERAWGAHIEEMQTYGDMPKNPDFPVAEQDRGLVLHARLILEGQQLMCADSSDMPAAGDNMYLSITTEDAARALTAWGILAEGGEIFMPLQETFFARHHGSLRDRFGICWMFTVPR